MPLPTTKQLIDQSLELLRRGDEFEIAKALNQAYGDGAKDALDSLHKNDEYADALMREQYGDEYGSGK